MKIVDRPRPGEEEKFLSVAILGYGDNALETARFIPLAGLSGRECNFPRYIRIFF